MTIAQSIILECDGSIKYAVHFENSYYFVTRDIHEIESYIAATNENLALQNFQKMPFWGFAMGIYGGDIVLAAVKDKKTGNGTSLGIYRQDGDRLVFFEAYTQESPKIAAVAKALPNGIIICYPDQYFRLNHVILYKPNKNSFTATPNTIPFMWSILERGIIQIPYSGDFFLTGNAGEGKPPAVFRFDSDCVLQETKTLYDFFPTAPTVELLAGCPLMPGSILFWGYAEESKAWWFGVYDIEKRTATQSAMVPPGAGIMPEIIYTVAPLPDGRLVVCTPAVLFLLDADFQLQGQWTAKQKNPPGFEGVSVTKDGTLLVLGSTLVERGGKAAAWIVSVQDFSPLTEVPDAYLSTRWDTSEEE